MLRRAFFKSIAIWTGESFLVLMAFIPAAFHLIGTVLRGNKTGDNWVDLGPIKEFSALQPSEQPIKITVRDGWRNIERKQVVFVVPDKSSNPRVFSSRCPHLACGVSYDPTTQEFRCPCHRSIFDTNGRVLSGPSPRNLDILPVKMENGNLFCRWVVYKSGTSEQVEI